MNDIKKTCLACNIEKPLTEYYKGKTSKDGHIGKCKSCYNAHRNQNRSEAHPFNPIIHRDHINYKVGIL